MSETVEHQHKQVANEISSKLSVLMTWLNDYSQIQRPNWMQVGSGKKVLSDLNEILDFIGQQM